MAFFMEYKGREIVMGREIVRGGYPFPLISKGERKIISMKTGGESMNTRGEMIKWVV